jgi:hypothetical protein
MKRFSFILLLIASVVLTINAQSTAKYCDFGVTFEISNNPSWGYGEPVLLSVEPFSPAEKAGLKVGDVIMEVNGSATYLRNYPTISSWFFEGNSPEIKLTVRNVDTYFKEYEIQRQCKSSKSISEFELATAYSFYSIEDTNDRSFSLPLKVDPNTNVDLSDYHTFDFIREEGNVPMMDSYINSLLEKALIERGLVKSSKDPDILIQSYYSYQPNLKYDPSTNSKNSKTWRYDPETKEMVKLPILSADDTNAELKGEFILELGLRFFDKKYIDKDKLTQIWDCRTREFLTDQYDLQEYTRIHAPLILMQFPYSGAKTTAKYTVSTKNFNYTGLNFSLDDLSIIADVDAESPAYAAGLRAGDQVLKIGESKFGFTPTELENGYRRFIVETMGLRDPKTKFIDANGFPDCMYWSKALYPQVVEAFKKRDIYTLSFSYLYAFEKYVAGAAPSKVLDIEVKSGGTKKKVRVTPQIQNSIVVKAN